jgi:hypothetical protein
MLFEKLRADGRDELNACITGNIFGDNVDHVLFNLADLLVLRSTRSGDRGRTVSSGGFGVPRPFSQEEISASFCDADPPAGIPSKMGLLSS